MDKKISIGLLLLIVSCGEPETPSSSASPPTVTVWMDVDPAVMPGGHEPDDGLALLQAFGSPELAIEGVSVVFGNSPLETGYPIAREIVERYGPEGLEVFPGASGAGKLGEKTEASRALAEALAEDELTILALGPATNVATVLENHPELSQQVQSVVAVAGRRPGQQFVLGEGGTPFMDFNFELDPEAFRILLDSGIPLVLAPFEISSKVPLPEEDIERFAEAPEIADFYLTPLRDYVDWYDERFGVRAIYPFDTLAVGYVTTPEWMRCQELPVEIQTLPDDIHPGDEKPYLLVSDELESNRLATYCHTAAEPFKDDLLRRMLRLP